MTRTQLFDRMRDIDREQAAIEQRAMQFGNGQFSDSQRERYDALHREFAKLKTEYDGMSRRTQTGSGSRMPNAQFDEHFNERTNPNRPPSERFSQGTRRPQARAFAAAGNPDPDEAAHRFGMWALAAMTRQMPGRFQFHEAVDFVADTFGDKYLQPMNVHTESDGTTGGHYLVPEEFGMDLIVLREMYGVARRVLRNVRMRNDRRNDPRRSSGLTVYFPGEGAAGTESTMAWDNVALTAKTAMVLTRMTAELSMDSAIDVGNTLADEIAYAFANKEDDCAFNGTGASTYAGIVGVRQALNTAAGSPTTTSAGGIIVGTGNAYSELVLGDFEDVVGILPQYADTPMTTWVMHRRFFYQVALKLALAAGGVAANEILAGGDVRGRPMFLGYPVTVSQVMPSTAANSQVCALLGDFTKGASFGDRQQDSILFSEHASVGGQSVFERNEIAVRGTERFDINVHSVGDTTTAGPIVGLQTLNA